MTAEDRALTDALLALLRRRRSWVISGNRERYDELAWDGVNYLHRSGDPMDGVVPFSPISPASAADRMEGTLHDRMGLGFRESATAAQKLAWVRAQLT